MVHQNIEKALNEQIKKEEDSSRLYLAMASWCEKKGYHGAANFLYRQSDEERMHMLKLVHYLNDRGGYSVLHDVKQPPNEFSSLKHLFQAVLKHEEYITASINKVYETCLKEKDYTTGNFIQWYINEQIEEESTMNEILAKMELAGEDKVGLFHIDKELNGMSAAKSSAENDGR
jgi:ferritin